MSNVFFTSDNHYYHANVIKYSNRPFLTEADLAIFDSLKDKPRDEQRKFRPSPASVEIMNEEMIRRHNATVGPTDVVYFNGDFGFSNKNNLIAVLERLNGEKHFNLGNHDQDIIKYRQEFIGDKRFKSIRDYRELRIDGQKIIMCHFAMRVWNKSHHGAWMLFGHSHGTLPPFGKSVDVGVDAPHVTGKPEYRPLSFHEVKTFMDKQEMSVVDHHMQGVD